MAALEEHHGVVPVGGGAGVLERPGLDLLAGDAEHPGQLAGVRREHRVAAPGELGEGEGVRVDDHGYVVGERVAQGRLCRGVAARADHPGLHATRADDLGMLRADQVEHGGVAVVPDHAGDPAGRRRRR